MESNKIESNVSQDVNEENSVDDLKSHMAIEGGSGLTDTGKPVHEMITLSALINSNYKLNPTTTYRSLRDQPGAHPEINDFLRGVMWNDDPECELFKNTHGNNLDYSTGLTWAAKYKFGGFQKPELIHRSHFGDLQWLHAMALGMDKPEMTKSRVLKWMELMYDVAIGATSPDTPISSTPVSGSFDDPSHYTTIGELLTHRHQSPAVVAHRALGSCFHVIQDSYAIGHTWRERLNPNSGAGEADRWGAIRNFHSYGGQNTDQHKHFDHGEDDLGQVTLNNPDSWNGLLGCRDGLDNCVILADYWHRKASWDEVRPWLENKVFELSPHATPSNPDIET
ncbi:hypothetical protein BDV95DRAFT_608435 [Massariosphaeria phaeospora]|uniref:Uncharacterized protein n=1 Tax=Massariosphaeria phaeospora TaxID=100035 RepID=A0A7C8I6T0_9PLEO|nr:hypothetical protein BDV95DRAFT_608435 [Massariosphaeria phaeospora]